MNLIDYINNLIDYYDSFVSLKVIYYAPQHRITTTIKGFYYGMLGHHRKT